jgi:hypothetical protein
MIEKVVIVFCICSLVNVILSTLKTLIMVNAGRGSAIIINAVCYGFYTLVVKQLGAVDYVTAVVVTVLANIVGVWISYKVMDLFTKDKLWKIEATFDKKENFTHNLKVWAEIHKIPCNFIDIDKYIIVNFYSATQKESLIIKEFIKKFNGKYFASETKNL